MTPETRQNVVREAMSWERTPYHHQGAVKGAGVDCIMLMVEVYKACGLIPADVDPRPYAKDWHLHRSEEVYLAGILQYAEKVDDVDRAQPGDIVLFQFGRAVSHGAIVIKWPLVLHAYVTHGAVVQTDIEKSAVLRSRVRGVYTLRE